MQTGRLFQILYVLLEQKNTRIADLAKQLEVSERTIRRDIDALSAAGIPVYTTQGRAGGVHLVPGFVLDQHLLSEQEQDHILYGLQLMQATGEMDVDTLLHQLAGQFERETQDWIAVDFSDWGNPTIGHTQFTLLKQSILQRLCVSFTYVSGRGEITQRVVEPVRLCFRGISWYLQAWCRTRKAFRNFKLARMSDLKQESMAFTERTPPALTWEPVQMQEVVLRFTKDSAHRVYDAFPHTQITKEPEGTFLVRAMCAQDDWLLGNLLSFGSAVQVLAPDSLREQVIEEIEKIKTIYENVDRH